LSKRKLPFSSNTVRSSNTCPVSITLGSFISAYYTGSRNRSGGSSSSDSSDATT
jgi:hypothetical protein